MKNLIAILFLALLSPGCIDMLMVTHGMFTRDPTIRNGYSWNIWGPTKGKSYEEYQREYQQKRLLEKSK